MWNDILEEKKIPFEDIATYPIPGGVFPADFSFSHDDSFIAYLHSSNNDLIRSLWLFDFKTNEKKVLYGPAPISDEKLSLEEQLRRERERRIQLGVTYFQWAQRVNRLLFSDASGIFVLDLAQKTESKKIIDLNEKTVIDPQLSPNGEWISYVYQEEVYITSFDGKTTKQLTLGAKESNKTHGLAEYVAQEEMGRSHGYWWSPNSKYIAFEESDQQHLSMMKTVHQGDNKNGEQSLEEYRYPFAGEKNATVKLAVVNITDLETIWMDLGSNEDIYLTRVQWLSDTELSAQIENREQTKLELQSYDITTGNPRVILVEKNETWINLNNLFCSFRSKKFSRQFIWGSERTGFMHLYLYDFDGKLIKQLTDGEFLIEEIVGIDEEQELLYATTTATHPTEKHLYAFSMKNGSKTALTKESGTHTIVMNKTCSLFIDSFNSIKKPPSVIIKSTKDQSIYYSLFTKVDTRIEKLGLKPPKMVSLRLPDETILYGTMFLPNESYGKGPFPTIVFVYGGPHAQLVRNTWNLTTALRVQNLRNNGFLIFALDNRGSSRRGLKFESILKNQIGKHEVEDQVFGVKWLIEQGLADKNRVGIMGWSYGGFMSVMCLATASDVFKVAFAGAPTNDMRDYDTFYTERYLGLPQKNQAGYDKSTVTTHTDKIRGKLLIAHGLIDENVHFKHTAKIINSLIKNNKDYSLLLFPDGRHFFRKKEDRIYLERKIFDFFTKSL